MAVGRSRPVARPIVLCAPWRKDAPVLACAPQPRAAAEARQHRAHQLPPALWVFTLARRSPLGLAHLGRNLAAQLVRLQAHSARKFTLGKEWLPEDVGDQHGHRLVLVEQAARPVLRVLLEERCRQRLDGRPGIADQEKGGLLGCRSLARSHGST